MSSEEDKSNIQKAIDSGEGWDMLANGTAILSGDEFDCGEAGWKKTGQPGSVVGVGALEGIAYRRRKPAQPEWPKFCEPNDDFYAFVRMDAQDRVFGVRRNGSEIKLPWTADRFAKRKQITESEALARLNPHPQPSEPAASQPEQKQPGTKRVPVRLSVTRKILDKDADYFMAVRLDTRPLPPGMTEVFSDGSGSFFVEVPQ